VKKIVIKWTGKYFKYYRLLYSFSSLILLIFLLDEQLQIKETYLFSSTPLVHFVAVFLIFDGLVIMTIAAKRYFVRVMGLEIFKKHDAGDTLLVGGIHNIIRHPLYAGTMLLIWGLFLCFPCASNLIVCLIITGYIFVGIKLEEKKLQLRFGEDYRLYCQQVPMVIPKLRVRKRKMKIEIDA
jgi:protein-S-isoprenylcysteine O-methyltransferase Ste14